METDVEMRPIEQLVEPTTENSIKCEPSSSSSPVKHQNGDSALWSGTSASSTPSGSPSKEIKPKTELSNGHVEKDKSEKKHKEKHKDRHKEKHKHKDKHKEKHRDKDKDKEREKRKEKEREGEKSKKKEEKVKVEKMEVDEAKPTEKEIRKEQRRLEKEREKERELEKEREREEKEEKAKEKERAAKAASQVKKRPRPDSEEEEEEEEEEDDESDFDEPKKKSKKKAKLDKKAKPSKKTKGKPSQSSSQSSSKSNSSKDSPKKGRKGKKEEEEEVWKWWEEAPRADGVKWNFLEHKGPVFAPDYEPVPTSVKFRYDGKPMQLSEPAEEVAGFYSRFIEHEYTSKEKFNINFFKDWRKVMTKKEREIITELKKCDFRELNDYYKAKTEERKAMTKEEKLKIKEENEAQLKEYGTCLLDGHKEKIGNFKIEPPGLFRGRGDHPKMGMLKRRVVPEDIIINCSKDSKYPVPPKGHKWKEVRHDNTVTWLACWIENVQGQGKYIMLNPTSRLKGEKDWMKYEKARELAKHIDKIREQYKKDFKSKEMRVRQRAVALYFIDKLALRAGNEKDEDQADTVGCCSLRFEHIKLIDEKDGQENVVVFDFLGKDSIRYYNEVPVESRVYKNLKIFMDNKKEGDDLFDRLNTAILNKHLTDLLDGLTAKVFRTYNASHTLQQQLDELTDENMTMAEKVLAYNRANRAVAVLCNHQRAVPKSHEKSMENLETKIMNKKADVKKLKKELKDMPKKSKDHEKKKAALARAMEQLAKMEMNKTDKEEGKEIALGTSKLNYLDPRISVGWCKKHDIPIEKVYNKTQKAKFRWAIDMADADFKFD